MEKNRGCPQATRVKPNCSGPSFQNPHSAPLTGLTDAPLMKAPLELQARTRTSQGASAPHPTCALASSSFLPVLTWLPAIEFGFLLHTPHSLLCLFQFYTLSCSCCHWISLVASIQPRPLKLNTDVSICSCSLLEVGGESSDLSMG